MTDITTRPATPPAGAETAGQAKRFFGLAYALFGYMATNATIAYLIAFALNGPLPVTVDKGPAGAPLLEALSINLALIALFGLQHSVMARPAVKRRLRRVVPAHLERTTFMLATIAVLIPLFAYWQPLPQTLFSVTDERLRLAIWLVAGAGWLIALWATFIIDHFELNGLRQVWNWSRDEEPEEVPFQVTSLYRIVRHPMQLGILIGVWAAPDLTLGRILFAGSLTLYVLIGIHFEERQLLRDFGGAYRAYQRRVPKLLPLPKLAPGTV